MPSANTRKAAAAAILVLTLALIWWINAQNGARSESVFSAGNPDAEFIANSRSLGRALSLAQMWIGALGGTAAILIAEGVRNRFVLWIVGALNFMVLVISVLYLFASP